MEIQTTKSYKNLNLGILEKALSEKIFSGFQLFAQDNEKEIIRAWGGTTSYWSHQIPIEWNSFFDIGSLTKIILTTSLYTLAVQEKKISLDASIAEFLTSFRGTSLSCITYRQLLSHTSGLIDWYPFYKDVTSSWNRDNLLEYFQVNLSKFLVFKPNVRQLYSDLGFILLGLSIEKCYKTNLAELAQRKIYSILKMQATQYGPIDSSYPTVATEFCLWRNKLLQGEVFDENAAAIPFPLGHAGLFSTAEDLSILCSEWYKSIFGMSIIFKKKEALHFITPCEKHHFNEYSLGWMQRSKTGSSSGDYFSSNSFGHLGFPGCSIWIDPEMGFIIFLTNRIHPSRYDSRIRDIRPKIHNEIYRAWEKK